MPELIPPALSVVIPTFNNVAVLQRCLEGWRTFADGVPVELVVIEDGCRDATADYLAGQAASPWGQRHLRWFHEGNVHELCATNRGLREARAPLVMTWHDDMFLRSAWFVPEILATFARRRRLGLFCLSRGLVCRPVDAPIATWDDLLDWRRLESTIGPRPLNWFCVQDVDAVIRPWVVRRACLDRVGALDEAFRPTGWDEADLAFRIRREGWVVATHGYERLGAFLHLGSTTFAKFHLNLDQDLRNGLLFHARWDDAIRAGAARRRRRWLRSATSAGWLATLARMAQFAIPFRRRAILAGGGV